MAPGLGPQVLLGAHAPHPAPGVVRPSPSRSDWAQLLEQASDFNDELHREHCELHREVSVLRQRQLKRRASAAWSNSGNEKSSLVRKLRAANLVPRVMSQVQQALHSPGSHTQADAEGLSMAVEDAIRRVLAAADASNSDTALASNEDTAALVTEKVALKEFSMRQQERLLELELAREKLAGSSQGHWATRLTSHLSALHGSLAEQQAAPSPAVPAANLPPEKPSPPSFCIGDECRIVGRKGAILRESENLDSKEVATLPPESRVRILELGAAGSRRARVQALAVAQAPVGETDGQGACEGSTENSSQQPSETGARQPAQDSITDLDEPLTAPAGWLSVATKDFKALIRHVVAREPVDVTPAATTAQVKDCSSLAGAEAGPDGNSSVVDTPQLPSQLVEVGASGPSGPVVAPSDVDGQTTGAAEVQDPLPGPRVSDAAVEGQPAPATTVTVSTEEWLALRNERNQRERQIKALQVQVETAQQELEQLAVVRTQLREQRNLALEARRRGTELYETALMAAEELASLRCEESELPCPTVESGMIEGSDCHEAPLVANAESGTVRGNAEAKLAHPEQYLQEEINDEQQQKMQTGITGKEFTDEQGEVQRQRSIEWQRLLSERETTATELGITLERIEQLEAILEDQRIELQITERRRERERRSLLTALRELNSQDCTKSDGDLTEGEAIDGSTSTTESQPSMLPEPPTASLLQAASSSASTSSNELQYLQKISRLEEVAARLRADLEKVQAREFA